MSVLSFPRIHFRGRFRTSPSTSNNNDVMYDVIDADNLRLSPTQAAKTDAELQAWLQEKVSMRNSPEEDTHAQVRSGWNLYGDFSTTFEHAVITSITTPEATHTSDLLIGEEVRILGSFDPLNSGRRGDPIICDLEATGLITTQIYIGGLQIGQRGSHTPHLQANHNTRAYMNYVSPMRVVGKYGGEQNFVSAGCSWQFTIPNEALSREHESSSPGLRALLEAAQRAAGLAVRFAIYEVQPELTTDELVAHYKRGQGRQNPAWGYLVGTLGVWSKGEPTSEVAGRLLQPPMPRPQVCWRGAGGQEVQHPEANAPDEGPPALISSVIAHVHSSPRVISLDLIGSFPKDGFRFPKGFHETGEKQADLGPVELVYIPKEGGAPVPIGDVDYGLEEYSAFANRGGIVDVPYDERQEDAIRRGTLMLRGRADNTLNKGVVLLEEVPVRVVTDDRALYLDPPGNQERPIHIRLHVTERGGPPSSQVTLYLNEYYNTLKPTEPAARKTVRPQLTVGPRDVPRLNFRSTVTVPARSTEPVTVKVSAARAGAAILAFQLENKKWRQGLTPWSRVCYSNVRVYTHDDFSALYAKGEIRWKDVYENVLRYYHVLFPAMTGIIPLNQPEGLTKPYVADELLRRISRQAFFTTSYMPITRSMSPGREELLRRWLEQEKAKQPLTGPREPTGGAPRGR